MKHFSTLNRSKHTIDKLVKSSNMRKAHITTTYLIILTLDSIKITNITLWENLKRPKRLQIMPQKISISSISITTYKSNMLFILHIGSLYNESIKCWEDAVTDNKIELFHHKSKLLLGPTNQLS